MSVQWVVKTTKLCNLRCQYCYEFPWLGDAKRMSASQLDAFFRHVAEAYADQGETMDFVWHGGEPLLLGTAFYDQVFELQQKHLAGAGIAWENSIQTNLTRLDTEQIELLRRFANVGVSIDVFGDLRVNAAGEKSQPQVLEHMQQLIDAGVQFGCITVLSRKNFTRLREIFTFFSDLQLSFRLLPIYRTGFLHQHDDFGLSESEILASLLQAVDLWFDLDSEIQVRPIHDYVLNVMKKYSHPSHQMGHYSKKNVETLFIVNTDGQLYSNADAYAAEYSYGSIFDTPLSMLLESTGHQRSVQERLGRIKSVCEGCEHFGACSGFYMGEATPEQRFLDETGRLHCGVVRPLTDAIEQRLIAAGVIDSLRHKVNPAWLRSMDEIRSCAAEF
jgi:uncharacterized protein